MSGLLCLSVGSSLLYCNYINASPVAIEEHAFQGQQNSHVRAKEIPAIRPAPRVRLAKQGASLYCDDSCIRAGFISCTQPGQTALVANFKHWETESSG
jgi:hypothetical protein